MISNKNLVLSKNSSTQQIKTYFERVLHLSKLDEQYPVDLEEVWMLVYSRKEEAVRSLKENFIENIDYQVLRKNAENPKGGRPANHYMLSVSCLEYFIARKIRPVFEVYRLVFHNSANQIQQTYNCDTCDLKYLLSKERKWSKFLNERCDWWMKRAVYEAKQATHEASEVTKITRLYFDACKKLEKIERIVR